jgi:hypothetical protein
LNLRSNAVLAQVRLAQARALPILLVLLLSLQEHEAALEAMGLSGDAS